MSKFKIFIIYMLNFKILEISRHANGKADDAGKYSATELTTGLNASPAATVLTSSNIPAILEREQLPRTGISSNNKPDSNPE